MTSKKIQLELFNLKTNKSFGGSVKSHPKKARPLCSKRAIHLVMRSRLAVEERSFLTRANSRTIQAIIRSQAKRFGVRLYDLVLVGNHLHAMLRISSQRHYRAFIRSISGLIARHVMKCERGRRLGLIGASKGASNQNGSAKAKRAAMQNRFWDGRPFTRILDWGRDYLIARRYLLKNRLEAIGFAVEIRSKPQVGLRDLPLFVRI